MTPMGVEIYSPATTIRLEAGGGVPVSRFNSGILPPEKRIIQIA